MSVRKFCATIGATAVVASGLAFAAVSPASAAVTPASFAEPQFTPVLGDYIGTGSDTTQFVVGDLASKYNATAGSGPKIASYASCKPPVAYDSCTTYADDASVQVTLPGDGTTAAATINRPKSSGDGRKLLFGATNQPAVLFARSSGVIATTDVSNGGGAITGYPFAVDSLVMVTATTTNAPASLTASQVLGIFNGTITNWLQVGGKSGAIHAYVPQSGSGTRDFFTGQLKNINGGIDVPATSLHDVAWNAAAGTYSGAKIQEHNPAAIKDDPNAIAPFSLGRVALTGNLVKTVKGFQADRAVYNYVRTASGAANAKGGAAWTQGGTVVNSLFGSAGFFCADAQRQTIADEGFFQLKTPDADPNGQCGVANGTASGTPATSAWGLGKVTTTKVAVTDGTASTPAEVDVTVAGANPTGDVVLNLGSYSATATLAGGAASFTVPTSLTAGSYDVNVSYLGDAANETSGFPKLAADKVTVTVADTQPCATATAAATSALTAYSSAKAAATKAASASTSAQKNVAADKAAVAAAQKAVTKAKKAVKKAKSPAKKKKAKKQLAKATKALKAANAALGQDSTKAASATKAAATAAAVSATRATAYTKANNAKVAACA
jgi:ABC-type phosphate transport system substrate-binding protein